MIVLSSGKGDDENDVLVFDICAYQNMVVIEDEQKNININKELFSKALLNASL